MSVPRVFLSGLLLAAGCGYQTGNLYRVDHVSVPIFENTSDQRINEFDLTDVVVREIQAGGVLVNPAAPRYVLKGRISLIDQPHGAEDREGRVTVGGFAVGVTVELIDARTRQAVRPMATRVFSASFAIGRGQTLETARAQVFDRIAKWVMEQLEKGW